MSIDDALLKRADSKCELCNATENLSAYDVPPIAITSLDKSVLVCSTCLDQIENPDNLDANHWRCLNDSMWSTTPAVQVMAWRMLNRLKDEGWPN
ncbi:MAG: PhnA domain protein, partial [Cocleimonas sp.]